MFETFGIILIILQYVYFGFNCQIVVQPPFVALKSDFLSFCALLHFCSLSFIYSPASVAAAPACLSATQPAYASHTLPLSSSSPHQPRDIPPCQSPSSLPILQQTVIFSNNTIVWVHKT